MVSALDHKELKSRFFIGVAAEQDGDLAKAAEIWRGMLANAPPPVVSAPGPNAQDVAAASDMSEKDRGTMIRGMVAQLAGRPKQNSDDIEGWQRPLRAYMVLGERDMAHAADARRALAGEPDKLRQIDDMVKSLGLEG
jgi:cytochrome c-type biogenesis protein CcmH